MGPEEFLEASDLGSGLEGASGVGDWRGPPLVGGLAPKGGPGVWESSSSVWLMAIFLEGSTEPCAEWVLNKRELKEAIMEVAARGRRSEVGRVPRNRLVFSFSHNLSGEAVREVERVALESADRAQVLAARLWGPAGGAWLLWPQCILPSDGGGRGVEGT